MKAISNIWTVLCPNWTVGKLTAKSNFHLLQIKLTFVRMLEKASLALPSI